MQDHEALRLEILKKTKEYYQIFHKPQQDAKFIPGKSRVAYAGRVFDEKEMVNLVDSSLEFWLTSGRYFDELEKKFAEYLGIKYALLTNSGSSANLLAFSALMSPIHGEKAIKKGDEVITVAAGFPTTISPIVQNGCIPVFVDIKLETANIDVSQLELAYSEKTTAVMIAHTLGNPFDLEAVKAFCDKHDLWLIEDNCDALGSKYNGEFTGTVGDVATSSFYPPHHMTMGEGGAIYTNNLKIRKALLSIRDWGRDCWCPSGKDNTCCARFNQSFGSLPHGYDHKYVYSHFGYNLKVTDMQAAVGVAQLEKLDGFTEKRKANYQYLYNGLKELGDKLILITATKNSDPSWFGFLMTIKDEAGFGRRDLVQYLEGKKIQTRNLFAGNITRQPLFEQLTINEDYRIIGDLKNTDKIMDDGFLVGVYPGMKQEAMDYMISNIKQFISENS